MPPCPLHILAIDLGTSGAKFALISATGTNAAAASRPVETERTENGGAEQDAEAIWLAVLDGCREVVGRAGVPAERIAGIAVASQFSSIVPVDASGRPLCKMITWMDGRAGPYAAEILAKEGAALCWLDHHGGIPLPSGADSLSKMLRVQHERPDVYEDASAFLEPMDYLAARLTGRFTANASTVFTMMLADHRDPNEARWDPELIRLAGFDREKLPELVPIGNEIGPVRPELASELGLSVGTPVYSGMTDNLSAAIATGTGTSGVGGLNVGTTCQVLAHTPRRHTDMESGIVSTPSPLPDQYYALAEVGVGGGSLDHLIRQVFLTSDALGDHSSPNPFAGIETVLQQSKPGAGGLLFLPWMSGSVAPQMEPAMRGGFLNWSFETTRSDMVRSVMEGVAFSLRWLLPAVEDFVGTRLESLNFSGGAARSHGWAKIMADTCNRPVRPHEDPTHAVNRASAFLAFRERGEAAAIETFCPRRPPIDPDPSASSMYERQFEQFVRAFEQTRPIYQALNG